MPTRAPRRSTGSSGCCGARGLCGPRRNERYRVGTGFGESLCEIDRTAVEFFGIAAYGVHLNGYVGDGPDLALWVPRRSDTVRVCPGRLDSTVAGGQPAGLGIVENLAKECDEEAGIDAALARRAAPAGTVTYGLDRPEGLRRGILFVFDLAMPEGFVPRNRDGEVGGFALWPARKAMRRIAETADFKFDSALVAIDFFVRRGLIPPHHPDYGRDLRGPAAPGGRGPPPRVRRVTAATPPPRAGRRTRRAARPRGW